MYQGIGLSVVAGQGEGQCIQRTNTKADFEKGGAENGKYELIDDDDGWTGGFLLFMPGVL